MAVDANILIFERMKEELRQGRTLLASINIGFNRAWPAIRDSNVSTLITCAILFWFADQLGAAVVQGFAVTLAIGVAISMFSAIFVSRTFLRIVAETGCWQASCSCSCRRAPRDLPQIATENGVHGGVKTLDYVGKRYLFFLLSALVIVPGIVFLIISPGLKPGIDFTGGSSIMLEFSRSGGRDGS